MITLTEALTQRFPHGNEWARQALGALGDGVEPSTMVHSLTQGWMQRTAGGAVELIDTLFILTDERIGLGQTVAGMTGSHWIPTRSIQTIDAIDDSPYPLETIEMRLLDGTELCVGWSDEFSEALVEVLTRQLAEVDAATDQSMPAELADPSSVQSDASSLDGLAPSEWVESAFSVQSVEDRVDLRVNPTFTSPDFTAPPAPVPMFGSRQTAPVAPSADVTAADHADAVSLIDDPTPSGSVVPIGFAPPGTVMAPPLVDAPVDFSHLPPPPAPAPAVDHRQVDDRQVDDTEGGSIEESTRLMPWHSTGVAWPETLKGVSYLGGHPGHLRKRKNGAMMFSPAGVDITGSGFQSWSMHIDWSFIQRIEILGADEVMFTEHMKVDGNSSAVVVEVLDGTKLFFEVRLRRPPSLRATLAPILGLVEDIRHDRTSC